ncbi:hypothetical protein [Salinicola tamaricis]|uniref:capsular polysaccharide export protein, LipB/KpsS family n=1 Tax=Salinicola tamaricis TaxID=1771309 RepID=UPI00101AE71E
MLRYNGEYSPCNVLETIDHVYTITSQVGIEALIRKIRVTTIGARSMPAGGLLTIGRKTLDVNVS